MVILECANILDVPYQYIAHQCNAVTSRAAHLSKSVFDRFPYADIYSPHTVSMYGDQRKVGNIIVCGDGKEKRYVINMVAQFYPGMVKYPNSSKDGFKARQIYFQMCLSKIKAIAGLDEIAFPWRIACGAAGGDWAVYRSMIEAFESSVSARVYICGLDKVEMGI